MYCIHNYTHDKDGHFFACRGMKQSRLEIFLVTSAPGCYLWKTKGKFENHGKTIGKWENHSKTIGKPWENGG